MLNKGSMSEFMAQRQWNFGNKVRDDRNPHIIRNPKFSLKPELEFQTPLKGYVTQNDVEQI